MGRRGGVVPKRRTSPAAPPTDPEASARAAGLRYVSDDAPGITREMGSLGWVFRTPDGRRISDEGEVSRILALGIPPAWTDVWICQNPRGHLQATGRDARGRKQYRYHPRWREVRDETKYHRIIAFAEALPRIRARTDADLAGLWLGFLGRDRNGLRNAICARVDPTTTTRDHLVRR